MSDSNHELLLRIRAEADLKAATDAKAAVTGIAQATDQATASQAKLNAEVQKFRPPRDAQGKYQPKGSEGYAAARAAFDRGEQKTSSARPQTPDPAGMAGMAGSLRDMKDAFQGAGGGVDGVLNALAAGGTRMALALSATATAAIIAKHSIEEFAQAQERVAKLDAALAQNGLLTDSIRVKYQELAGELQAATGVADDEWIGVLTRLTQFGAKPETIGMDAEAVKNLAGLMGGDVTTAANAYSRALQGNYEMFRRYGIEVQAAGTQTEKLAALQEQAAQRGGGQLEAVNQTLNGQFRAMKNNANDLFEALGRGAASTGILQTGTAALSETFKWWAGVLGGTVPKVDGLKNSVAEAARTEAEAAEATKALAEAQDELNTAIDASSRALARELGLMDAKAAAADKLRDAQLRLALAKIDADPNLSKEDKATAKAVATAKNESEREAAQQQGLVNKRNVIQAAEAGALDAQAAARGQLDEAQAKAAAEKKIAAARMAARKANTAVEDQQAKDEAEIANARAAAGASGVSLSPEAVAGIRARQAEEIARLKARAKMQEDAVVAPQVAAFEARFGAAPVGVDKANDALKAAEAAAKTQDERVQKESPARQKQLEELGVAIKSAAAARPIAEQTRAQEVRNVARQGNPNLPALVPPPPKPVAPRYATPEEMARIEAVRQADKAREEKRQAALAAANIRRADAASPLKSSVPYTPAQTGPALAPAPEPALSPVQGRRVEANLNGAGDTLRRTADATAEFANAVAEAHEQTVQALADAEARIKNSRP